MLEKTFNNFNWKYTDINIDKTWKNIHDLWKKNTISTIGKKTITHKPTPWWNKHINKLHSEIKQISRKNQKLKRKHRLYPHHTQQVKRLISKKNKAIRKAKTQLCKNINKILQTSPTSDSSFWKALNKFKRTTQHNIPTLQYTKNNQDITVTDIDDKLESIHDIIMNPPSPRNTNPIHINHYNKIEHWYTNKFSTYFQQQQVPKNTSTPFPFTHTKNPQSISYILNQPITIEELNQQIQTIKNAKAMGPDEIHNKMLKNTGPIFRSILVKLFNISLKTGLQPKAWQIDRITPIPKPNKDHTHPKNYRPIAVSSTVGRLLQKVIAARLQHYCYELGFFGPNQSGFQINRSGIDAILPLYQSIIHNQDINFFTSLLQTDFSKAYDTVWHNGLLYKLTHSNKLNIRGPILKWIDNFLKNRYTYNSKLQQS